MPRIEQVDKNLKKRVGKLLAGLTEEEKTRIGVDVFDPEATPDPASLSGRVKALENMAGNLAGDLAALDEEIKAAREGKSSLLENLQSIRQGGGGSGGKLAIGPTERFVAAAGQTDFVLQHSAYEVGKDQLWVFRNGVLQTAGATADYIEVDERTIRFNEPLQEGELVTLALLISAPAAPSDPSPGDGSETGYASIGITDERLDLLASIVRATNHAGSGYFVGKTMAVDPLKNLEGIDMESSYGAIWRAQGLIQTPKDATWELIETATKPTARYSHAMAYDSRRGVVVLFGGYGSTVLGDTWEYDGTDWRQVNTVNKPSARHYHALAYDSNRGVVVLFGGYGGSSTFYNDTWEYDGTDWRQVNTVNKPSGRYSHALAYDSNRGMVVLFGGYVGNNHLNDTWEYDGTDWRQVNTANKPAGRRNHALAYDSNRGVVVLFGGSPGPLNDTWEYDGTDWRQVNTANKPPSRQNHALAYDSNRGVVVLFGGYVGNNHLNDTWEYDGTDWIQRDPYVVPSARYQHAMAYDSRRGVTVLFGSFPTNNETWELTYPYDDVRIITKPIELEKPPKAVGVVTSITNADESFTVSVSLDDGQTWLPLSQNERVPLDGITGTKLRLKFEWHDNRALKLNSWAVTWDYGLVAPPGEEIQAGTTGITDRDLDVLNSVVRASKNNDDPFWIGNLMAVDSLADLSGIDVNQSSGYIWRSGVLQQEPPIPDWAEIPALTKPSQRYGHAMVYDSKRRVVVLFGGSGGSTYLNDTWEYDGASWRQVSTEHVPQARRYHAMAYDSIRGVVVLFGGSPGPLNDTWEYDGTDWRQVNTANKPAVRYQHALAYDSNRGVVVLFGGSSGPDLNDTWEYDGIDWRQVNTANKPTARNNHALAYDSNRGVVVLFGGYGGGYRNDTWEYDGTDWRQVNTANKPSGCSRHALAYDSNRGVVVLFGGYSGSNLNDTWEYDGTDWRQVNTASKPSARYYHALAYDSNRGVVVLFGGQISSTYYNDTWELVYQSDHVTVITQPIPTRDVAKGIGVTAVITGNASAVTISLSRDDGATWHPLIPNQRIPLDTLPPGNTIRLRFDWEDVTVNLHAWGVMWDYGIRPSSEGGSYYDDLLIQTTVNLAKTNFKLNSHIEATRQRLSGMIVDVFSDLSGIDTQKSKAYEYDTTLKELRTLLDLVWEESWLENKPPARYGHAMAYDSRRGVVVLFGGIGGSGDTWEYDGTTWRQVNTANKPTARNDHALAYDSNRGVVVLFGGSSGSSETWEYDGTDWRQINTANKPAGRHYHALAYDSNRGVVVLFGGYDGSTRFNDTWEYDGTDWRQVNTANKPAGRSGHALAYDSNRGVVVLFGGYNGSIRFNDTWEYDGTDWRQVNTVNKPPIRSSHALAYDSNRGVVVLFGGTSGGSAYYDDNWEYDGIDWRQVNTASKPSGRYSHALAYDSNRGVVVLFGGSSGTTRFNDTWEYWNNVDPAEVVSVADTLDTTPSKLYFVPHIPDGAPFTGKFFMSLDGGNSWFDIPPEQLIDVPAEANKSNPIKIAVKAEIPPSGRLSGWAYGWV